MTNGPRRRGLGESSRVAECLGLGRDGGQTLFIVIAFEKSPEPTAVHDLGDIGGSQRDDGRPETQHGTNDLMAGIEGDSAVDGAEEHCHDSIKKPGR